MDITIRKAQSSDSEGVLLLLEQIAELHHAGRPDIFKSNTKKYSKDDFAEILKDDAKPVFVAVDEDDNVLGYVFCMLSETKDHAVLKDIRSLYIDDFCVDTSLRGQHIGKKLFEAVKNYAFEIGAYNIDLNVWEFNEGAIEFYQKCGFVTQRRRMEMVVLSNPEYERLCGQHELYSLLDEGLADIESKKSRPAKDVFADIERKFGFEGV